MLLSNKHGCKRGSVLVNITYKAVFCLGGMQLFIEVTVCRRPCCQIKENTFYVRGKKRDPSSFCLLQILDAAHLTDT